MKSKGFLRDSFVCGLMVDIKCVWDIFVIVVVSVA
jgi:hypothetical protein